ncbi:MAG: SPFH domain-containing protein [Candidatus Obscuribacter sp.]|nr:SPFH domain-containing protein [Candidatus Obscuribacter sp.]
MSILKHWRAALVLSTVVALAGGYGYWRTGGVTLVPENSVGLILSLDRSHSESLTGSGPQAAIPFWQTIKVVSTAEQTHKTQVLKAKTVENLPVAVVMEVKFKRQADAAKLAKVYLNGEDKFALVLEGTLELEFKEFADGTSSLQYLPQDVLRQAMETQLLKHLQASQELNSIGVDVVEVRLNKQWLDPALQVPADTTVKAAEILKIIGEKARSEACKENPTCS